MRTTNPYPPQKAKYIKKIITQGSTQPSNAKRQLPTRRTALKTVAASLAAPIDALVTSATIGGGGVATAAAILTPLLHTLPIFQAIEKSKREYTNVQPGVPLPATAVPVNDTDTSFLKAKGAQIYFADQTKAEKRLKNDINQFGLDFDRLLERSPVHLRSKLPVGLVQQIKAAHEDEPVTNLSIRVFRNQFQTMAAKHQSLARANCIAREARRTRKKSEMGELAQQVYSNGEVDHLNQLESIYAQVRERLDHPLCENNPELAVWTCFSDEPLDQLKAKLATENNWSWLTHSHQDDDGLPSSPQFLKIFPDSELGDTEEIVQSFLDLLRRKVPLSEFKTEFMPSLLESIFSGDSHRIFEEVDAKYIQEIGDALGIPLNKPKKDDSREAQLLKTSEGFANLEREFDIFMRTTPMVIWQNIQDLQLKAIIDNIQVNRKTGISKFEQDYETMRSKISAHYDKYARFNFDDVLLNDAEAEYVKHIETIKAKLVWQMSLIDSALSQLWVFK